MKKIFLMAACSLFIFSKNVNAQTEADGTKAMLNENFSTAKSIYAPILKANPADADKWFNLGEAYFKNEQFDSAKIIYQGGIAANPRFPANYVGLGKCFLVEGKKDDALKNFNKVIDMVSGKDIPTAVLVAKGYICDEKNGMPDLAIELMKKKIEMNDKSASAYEALGDAYLFKNDGGNAMTNYEAAVTNDPKRSSVLVKMGMIYVRAKNLDEAAKDFNKAIEIDEAFPPAHRELSDLYFFSGKFEKAKTEYDTYLKYADQTPETRVRNVINLYKTERYDDVIKAANTELSSQPNNYKLYRYLAYSLVKQDKMPEAESAFTNYFKLVPADKMLATDYSNYVKALTKTGKDSIAIVTMKKAMEVDKNADFTNDILAINFKQKKYNQVIADYEVAMNNGYKGNANTYFYASRSYYYNENWKMADSVNKKITEILPSSPSGWLGRAQCCIRLDPESTLGLAKPFYEKYLETVKMDDAKNKGQIINAYRYLASYAAIQQNDNATAKSFIEKILVLDPEDAQAKEAMTGLK
jgi:tetratricopeptide (TPR) repeat protein